MANVKRIRKVVAAIEKNKNDRLRFDMGQWATEGDPTDSNWCGTRLCFAGWTAHLYGGAIIREEANADHEPPRVISRGVHFTFSDFDEAIKLLPTVSEFAKDELGLSKQQADYIFLATWIEDVSELKVVIEEALEEKIWNTDTETKKG